MHTIHAYITATADGQQCRLGDEAAQQLQGQQLADLMKCTAALGGLIARRFGLAAVPLQFVYTPERTPAPSTRSAEACAACSHPQAEWRPGEPSIMGSVKEAVCCTIHGRGTCGSPLHIHYCPVHDAAPDLLEVAQTVAAIENQPPENRLAALLVAIEKATGAIAQAEGR